VVDLQGGVLDAVGLCQLAKCWPPASDDDGATQTDLAPGLLAALPAAATVRRAAFARLLQHDMAGAISAQTCAQPVGHAALLVVLA